jgi:hypothetical protein
MLSAEHWDGATRLCAIALPSLAQRLGAPLLAPAHAPAGCSVAAPRHRRVAPARGDSRRARGHPGSAPPERTAGLRGPSHGTSIGEIARATLPPHKIACIGRRHASLGSSSGTTAAPTPAHPLWDASGTVTYLSISPSPSESRLGQNVGEVRYVGGAQFLPP